jgi:predicted acylesterase/phospholipase RssA
MPIGKSPSEQKAEDILSGNDTTAKLLDLFALAKSLKNEKSFGYARKILGRARKDPELKNDPSLSRRLAQQQALCTAKDPDLSSDQKFALALEILQEGDDLAVTTDQETLGIAGGIYKRKWQEEGQRQHLEHSLVYYMRGYKVGVASDYGYTAINAAYILDILVDQELREIEEIGGIGAECSASRRELAKRIREDIVNTLPLMVNQPDSAWLEKEWWFLVTLAEAHFGLEQYSEASDWLKKAKELRDVPEWEYETTARQLASIAHLQAESTGSTIDLIGSPAWEVLSAFLEENYAGVRTAFVGKLGLALSGGGFRASLYHIGVLARLAELDILRHVEVLSCISGGSIIGAHYYLEVRKLLQEKPDAAIKREDYIDIIKRIEADFLKGVEKNIRTRVVAEFLTNLKMILLPNYSRTLRVGELFEKELFGRVQDGEEKKPRWLNLLKIRPHSEPENFSPKSQNWRRHAKVPILILNATTLNTGHNWQFTVTWMGEPPASFNEGIDGNCRLQRMYYEEAPAKHRQIRLGHAVAASACVPALFEPLALTGLYEQMTVRLVDGGVHDNQGIAGLLEQECAVMLVSDASGQMPTQDDASNSLLSVLGRSNSILQARVREAQFHVLEMRRRAALLRGQVFVHLKKGLEEKAKSWIGCQEPAGNSDEARTTGQQDSPSTDYGIQRDIQGLLATIRTDLDSFTEAESYALMTSGYRMVEHEFSRFTKETVPGNPSGWKFLSIEESMRQTKGSEQAHSDLKKLLKAASHRAWKPWRVSRAWATVYSLFSLSVIVFFLAILWLSLPTYPQALLRQGGWNLFWLLVGVVLLLAITRLIFFCLRAIKPLNLFRKTFWQFLFNLLLGTVVWPLASLHLHVFDGLYVDWGKMKRFERLAEADKPTIGLAGSAEQPSAQKAA